MALRVSTVHRELGLVYMGADARATTRLVGCGLSTVSAVDPCHYSPVLFALEM